VATYVDDVAPEIVTHEEMSLFVHRSHWYVKLIGCAPDHVPLLTVNFEPTLAGPLMAGRTVFCGAVGVV